MPVLRTCLVCSATFTAYPSEIRSGHAKYCSRRCFNQVPRDSIPFATRFWALVIKTEGCWLWQGSLTGKGYGQFTLDDRRNAPAHRLAYELTFGMILPGVFCLHACDVRNCVRPDHLFLGTQWDNVRDMMEKGRHYTRTKLDRVPRGDRHGTRLHPETRPRGERHPCAKLTEAQVQEIRHLRATEQMRTVRLAALFGVTPETIYKIISRQIWKHLD